MSEAAIVEPVTSPGQLISHEIMEREKKYVLQNYGRYPLALDRGKGCFVVDFEGKRYLDLLSGIGVNALGHGHPRILKVLREQAAKMIHCSNLYYNEYQGLLAERICRVSHLERAFFCNSGAEGIEAAIKMIRSHGRAINPEKYEIISLENSFHGRTIGAISVTGQPKYRADFEPLLPGVRFVPVSDDAGLEAAVTERTAGIIIEVIQGEGGVYPVCERMLRAARAAADRVNALLVFDEIQCGVGRSGFYFAYQQFNPEIRPDVMVTAKPLGVGIPMGVVAANEKAAASIKSGMHGTTFGGGPLACRVALETLDVLTELLPVIRQRSDYFRAQLNELCSKIEFVREVRVRGLMIGIELKMPGKQLVTDALEEGLLINCTHDTVLRFLPPFIISEKEIDLAVRILRKLFKKGNSYYKDYLKSQKV
jgi:predicted acetylornithine/succinylornithine family transaminase